MDTLQVWMIEHADTGEWLGQFKNGDGRLEFGARSPVFWREMRYVKKAWLHHCVAAGWIRRGITMPGAGVVYHRTETFLHCPRVRFKDFTLTGGIGMVPATPSDLGITLT